MTPKQGHTAGAMRAAHKILHNIRVYNDLAGIKAELPPVETVAELIDQETGAAELLAALKRAAPLLQLLTVRQVLEDGSDAIEASGLNPYCMNEGLANGDESIDPWWADAAIRKAESRG